MLRPSRPANEPSGCVLVDRATNAEPVAGSRQAISAALRRSVASPSAVALRQGVRRTGLAQGAGRRRAARTRGGPRLLGAATETTESVAGCSAVDLTRLSDESRTGQKEYFGRSRITSSTVPRRPIVEAALLRTVRQTRKTRSLRVNPGSITIICPILALNSAKQAVFTGDRARAARFDHS